MKFDVRTIMVLFAMLCIIISGLILLSGPRTRTVNSVKQWSIAYLCLGVGLGFSYFFNSETPNAKLSIVFGAALIAASIAFQFTGLQTFKLSRPYFGLTVTYISVAILQTYWFVYIQPDIMARAIANSLLLSLGYATCASLLLVNQKAILSRISWLIGLSFVSLSLVMVTRAIAIMQAPTFEYSLYLNTSVNPLFFLVCCLLHICIAFGFLWMLDQQLITDIEKTASKDSLTGAYNRRQLEQEISKLQSRFQRTGDIFSLMLIDIDNFKSINDHYGHLNGDEVLRSLTNVAFATIRNEDYFARYGGDEFCVLLPATSKNEALIVADRLREAYAAIAFAFKGKIIRSSISIGIADSSSIGKLIEAADDALYQAKLEGRNKVISYTERALVTNNYSEQL